MSKKKVYKLKTWPKVLFFVVIILVFFGPKAYNKYQDYLYTKTYEYKLVTLGYSKEQSQLMEKKLSPKERENVLTYEYNEFIPEFVKCKYFIYKNLDGYLSQVISQDEDFFKYHGVDGYDYDFIVAKVNTNSIYPVYENYKETDISKEYGLIVNKYYNLGNEYKPSDLVKVDWKYRLGGANDIKEVRQEAYDAYLNMWEAAKAEDIYLLVHSAYRSYDDQVRVYNEYENSKGTKYADSIAARPGFSEHQTGLALDIYSKECTNSKTFANSKTYEWLINNSYKYGYILRYPEGKNNQEITGYNYESWHYRYVGVELAQKIHDENITFDEYYAFYMDK